MRERGWTVDCKFAGGGYFCKGAIAIEMSLTRDLGWARPSNARLILHFNTLLFNFEYFYCWTFSLDMK